MEGSYTSDFVSGSYAPDKSRGSKSGKPKEQEAQPDNEDSEQYSVKFDEASVSVSRKTGKDIMKQATDPEG